MLGYDCGRWPCGGIAVQAVADEGPQTVGHVVGARPQVFAGEGLRAEQVGQESAHCPYVVRHSVSLGQLPGLGEHWAGAPSGGLDLHGVKRTVRPAIRVEHG
ncbi:hypothetical protein [Streptomyces sp. NPDC005407]|uniref:hypothetical protein n=1 Tax=Streptomyces sp. NPDC005407 TaxID=3155340 RepID=UPI0033A65599